MERFEMMLLCALCIVIVVGIPAAWILETHQPYTETVVLQKQYIGNISGVAGGCEDCLIMEVSHKGYNKTYYFANEHMLRGDLVEGYEIKVHWKYVFTNGYYRIRGIYQPTPKDGFRDN